MNSSCKWAISKPQIKGAVGLALWTMLAYWPELKFTSIQQVCFCLPYLLFLFDEFAAAKIEKKGGAKEQSSYGHASWLVCKEIVRNFAIVELY